MRAVEDALKIKIPTNARLIRNIIEAIQYVQDHVVHFYHLHALDWVDITSALEGRSGSDLRHWPNPSRIGRNPARIISRRCRTKLKAFVDSGQLGLFANAYWGHPAYKLPPEANLMAVAHYLEALDWQREVIKAHAILGAKNPHLQTYLVGGMSIPVDPNSQAAINADKIAQLLGSVCQGQGICGKGLPAGCAGGGTLLPGMGRGGRGAGQLHVLWRFAADR